MEELRRRSKYSRSMMHFDRDVFVHFLMCRMKEELIGDIGNHKSAPGITEFKWNSQDRIGIATGVEILTTDIIDNQLTPIRCMSDKAHGTVIMKKRTTGPDTQNAKKIRI